MTDVQRFDQAVAAARRELDGKMLADMTALIEITVKWKQDPTAFSEVFYSGVGDAYPSGADPRERISSQPRPDRARR
jgi:hypothetical protein